MDTSHYKFIAKNALQDKWPNAILVTFVAALLGGLVAGSNVDLTFGLDAEDLRQMPDFVVAYIQFVIPFALLMGLAQLILGGAIELGYCRYLLKLYDGQDADLGDLFSEMDRLFEGFCLAFLRGLFVFLWSLLFIIPGIIAAYRYAMAPFILSEKPYISALDAINESKEMMQGRKMELFVLDLSFIGWSLLAALTLGIGSLWLNPYMSMTKACFYRELPQ